MANTRSQDLIGYYAKIHQNKEYGRSSEYQLGYVQKALLELDTPINSVLDFGCGQSHLVDWLAKLHDCKGYRYDPAIPEHSEFPVKKADLVICNDVLEHIPEEDLPGIFKRISSVTDNAFFAVDCEPAGTRLPNGENAHCTVYPRKWWLATIGEYFENARFVRNHSGNKKASIVTWKNALA